MYCIDSLTITNAATWCKLFITGGTECGIWKLSVLLSQFFCKSQTVLKAKFIIFKKCSGIQKNVDTNQGSRFMTGLKG